MHIKAVIFDLDGTISVFNLDYKTVRAQVKSLLEEKGVPASLLSIDDSVFEMLRKTEEWTRNAKAPSTFLEVVKAQALSITEKHEIEAAQNTTLLPGVAGTLKALRKMGLKIGLCTINGEKSASCILDRFGIASLFDVTIARNQVKRVKPHPEHIEKALRVLSVTANEVVVAGDSIVDMKSASELKAIAIGIPTGVSTAEQLMNGGANFILTSIRELPKLIQRINKSQEDTP